jgi:hypothetical protein
MRCLEKLPEARFQTVEELRTSLEHCCDEGLGCRQDAAFSLESLASFIAEEAGEEVAAQSSATSPQADTAERPDGSETAPALPAAVAADSTMLPRHTVARWKVYTAATVLGAAALFALLLLQNRPASLTAVPKTDNGDPTSRAMSSGLPLPKPGEASFGSDENGSASLLSVESIGRELGLVPWITRPRLASAMLSGSPAPGPSGLSTTEIAGGFGQAGEALAVGGPGEPESFASRSQKTPAAENTTRVAPREAQRRKSAARRTAPKRAAGSEGGSGWVIRR